VNGNPDFARLSRVVAERTGLIFPPTKEAEFWEAVEKAYGESGCQDTYPQFLFDLEHGLLGRSELKKLMAALTVGETYFFRNSAQFNLLREKILPEILRQRGKVQKTLRFWSAGCSTGEEAYSLAILLLENVPHHQRWNIDILATDINQEALDTAEQGEYREWSFRELPADLKSRYFVKVGSLYKISPEVRNMVTFRYLNLVEDTYPLASTSTHFMDVIFCRNVMIYFKRNVSETITRRFYRALNNGGYLLVGHTESSDFIYSGFKKMIFPAAIVYRKEEKGGQWDRGLSLRFRGSGGLPTDVIPSRSPGYNKPVSRTATPSPIDLTKTETLLFQEGATAYGQGNHRLAMGKFRQVLEMNPRNHRAAYLLALMEANTNNLRKAEEYCLQAIEGFSFALEAHYLLAIIAREQGDRNRELECLKKVLYINRDFVLGQYQIGVYYLQEGNLVLARKFFSTALRLLDKWKETDYIEGTDGLTVGLLKKSVERSLDEIREDSDGGAMST
jgi:chemotaxis protein methyltransferase CheR